LLLALAARARVKRSPGSPDAPIGLSNFGLQTFRAKPPRPDHDASDDDGPLALVREETPENGFTEVAIALEAADFVGAKLEAWRHWQMRLYGEEARGYVIVDALSNETVHS